ncbi:MAG: hypothetical protein D6723_17020 [Acidobacteria bacterium]|nr:MAG: hypothetical protein D6723_17020 [Acidobacteriota bacterium]
MKKTSMKAIQATALAAGLALFVYLIRRVGVATILHSMALVGFNFIFILLTSSFKHTARAIAWKQCIPDEASDVRLGELFLVRLAGESVRYLTFTGPLLGEPSKAALIRHRLSLLHGFSSVIVEAMTYALVSIIITVSGLFLLLALFAVPGSVQTFGLIVGGAIAGFTFFWYLAIRRRWRVLSHVVDVLRRRLRISRLATSGDKVRQFEEQVYGFFTDRPGRLALVLLLELLSHLSGVVEIYLVLMFLGYESHPITAVIIESITKLINAAFFFVPGQVGVYEGGQALVLNLLGLGTAAGVTLALIEKIRNLFWAAVGLLILAYYILKGRWARPQEQRATE